MKKETKQKLTYWLIGLFTGSAVAVPVTAFVTKSICDRKTEEAVAAAADEAETRGMNAMAEYAIQQQSREHAEAEEEDEEQDISEYDLSLDDDDIEAKERTEAHERYLDMIDKYNGNAEIAPHIIDSEQFINEQYMDKCYVNWYEEDNVFEEDLSTIDDPYATFGVTNGKELFVNADMRPDPDICYVRNERITTDFEISRIHGSYARMVGGEQNLGETDT